MKSNEKFSQLILDGLNQALSNLNGSKAEKFHRLANGWESTIYGFDKTQNGHSEPIVMRYYSPGMTGENATREWETIRYLYQQGYPVPKLIGNPPGERLGGSLYFLMERIDGYPMWSRLKTPEQYAVGLSSVAELMTALHRIDPQPMAQPLGGLASNKSALTQMFQDWRRVIPGGTSIADAFLPVMEWLEGRIDQIHDVPCSILHFDLHPENVMVEVKSGRKVVIDWTGATINDPRLDVFWAALLVGHQAAEPYFDMMLDAYENTAGLSVEDRDFFTALVCTRRIASMVISALLGSESLGMQGDVGASISRQIPQIRTIYRRFITATDGMQIPLVESYLAQFPE